MRLLLDTHAFIWGLLDDPRLSPPARQILGDPTHELLLSAASGWEMAAKWLSGRLRLPADPVTTVTSQAALRRVTLLAVEMRHALRTAELPLHHRDPFDRMLVAQAQLERLPILTADPRIRQYTVEVIW